MFDLSLIKPLDAAPVQRDALGNVTATMDGVLILLTAELVAALKAALTPAQQTLLQSYVTTFTPDQAGSWNIPVWCGHSDAVYVRVPAIVWSNISADPPLAVKKLLQFLWRP